MYPFYVAARRSDSANFTGQAKTPVHTNTKGKHAEHLDTSRFASETVESEVGSGIKRYIL
jgi:hypothetical protein